MNEGKCVLARIEAEAQENRADLRWVRACRPGDEIRQGDVYLYPLDGEPAEAGPVQPPGGSTTRTPPSGPSGLPARPACDGGRRSAPGKGQALALGTSAPAVRTAGWD